MEKSEHQKKIENKEARSIVDYKKVESKMKQEAKKNREKHTSSKLALHQSFLRALSILQVAF
jgi:hypothetical protein